MKPQNDQSSQRVGMSLNDQSRGSSLVTPPRQTAPTNRAAADLVRSQLDNIYAGNGSESTPHTTPVAIPQPQPSATSPQNAPTATEQPPQSPSSHGFKTAPPKSLTEKQTEPDEEHKLGEELTSTYERTMSNSIGSRQPSQQDWSQYHSAWQKYYQMYYERQYLAKGHSAQEATKAAKSHQERTAEEQASMSQDEAMLDLRNSIRQKVTDSATKVRKSRHFLPALAGLAVLLIFVGLQYNRQIVGTVMAYTSPGNIDPQHIITDPTTDVDVGPDPRMIIPKINIDAPVVYGVGPDHNSQMAAMENGIAHFSIPGASAVPGQVGNAVFAAHSSNDAFARGDYKFVFAHNERLVKGDVVYMNYEGKRYTYSVTSTEVVLPTEVSKIQIQTDKPMLTLISCVPLGTAEKRLLVFAEQISPDISGAKISEPDDASAPSTNSIPGQPAPTLLERLFGSR